MKSNKVFEHWVNSLPDDVEFKHEHLEMAKTETSKFESWKLCDVDIDTILNYTDTNLESDFFVLNKVMNYIELYKTSKEIPAIIIIPLNRTNKKLFLENKYKDNKIIWEPLDGIHRILLCQKLGFKTIKCYLPEVENV